MADEVDKTLHETAATIAKTDALLKQAQEMLDAGNKLMEDNNVSPDALHAFIDRQSPAGKAEFAKEVQAINEEIERDLPKQQPQEPAMRPTRVRPNRQMI
jgi:hypothetical protein